MASRAKAKSTPVRVAKKQAPQRAPGEGGLRVRMYRVGFGDFFLVTIPTEAGPRFILIDCGVHAADIGSMPDCVRTSCASRGASSLS